MLKSLGKEIVKSFRLGFSSTQYHAICTGGWGFVGRLKTTILIFDLFSEHLVNPR